MIQAVEFCNKKGLILRGLLDFPVNAQKIVVMLHGFTGNKLEHNGHFRNLSRLLSKLNIASLRMDYHGNGESDGEFSDFDFDFLLEDAKQMLEYARNLQGIKEVFVLGYSLGGAVASLVVNDLNAHKLLLWSPAGSMVEIVENRFNNGYKLSNGNVYFSGFEMSEQFVKTIKKYNMYQNTNLFNQEVLIIHGREDKAVNWQFGKKYQEHYLKGRIQIIDDAGHGYDEYDKRNELYRLSLAFLD